MLEKPERPVKQSKSCIHWILPKKLAVGRLPRLEDAPDLMQANIKGIFSLCAPQEGALPATFAQQFHCRRYVLPDSHYKTALEVRQVAAVAKIINSYLQKEEPVYVHCFAGMERSPTACIAYLCRYQGLELWEALHWVKQVHRRTQLTDAQVRVLREFVESFEDEFTDKVPV